jgi:hypothetical protein
LPGCRTGTVGGGVCLWRVGRRGAFGGRAGGRARRGTGLHWRTVRIVVVRGTAVVRRTRMMMRMEQLVRRLLLVFAVVGGLVAGAATVGVAVSVTADAAAAVAGAAVVLVVVAVVAVGVVAAVAAVVAAVVAVVAATADVTATGSVVVAVVAAVALVGHFAHCWRVPVLLVVPGAGTARWRVAYLTATMKVGGIGWQKHPGQRTTTMTKQLLTWREQEIPAFLAPSPKRRPILLLLGPLAHT